MIDCQNTYVAGVMALDGVAAALDEAAGLLERARSAGIPIIHFQHDDGEGSLYDIRAEIGQIVDRVAPRENETVIIKQFPNAFVHTDLDDRLKAASAHHLVLAGFMTHMCINSTARGAFNLGYAAHRCGQCHGDPGSTRHYGRRVLGGCAGRQPGRPRGPIRHCRPLRPRHPRLSHCVAPGTAKATHRDGAVIGRGRLAREETQT